MLKNSTAAGNTHVNQNLCPLVLSIDGHQTVICVRTEEASDLDFFFSFSLIAHDLSALPLRSPGR